jgi:hypothetical protein
VADPLPAPTPDSTPSIPSGPVGAVPGQPLELGPLLTQNIPDEGSVRHFILHIPIKAQPGAQIDPKALTIHVLFYDLVDGQNVEQTCARLHTHWATTPADWTQSETQELLAEYQLPKEEGRQGVPREDRKFYGYAVRVYYQQRLQSWAYEPARLFQQYPPPESLAASDIPSPPVSTPTSSLADPPSPAGKAATTTVAPTDAKTLDLFPIKSDPQSDLSATKHVRLQIPIRALHHARIDVKDVVVQVLFYDLVDGQTVVPTIAHVTTHWATPPADWFQTDIEELNVDYILPRPAPDSATPLPNRNYYGYLVRLYYKDHLQAVSGAPERLLRDYPAPALLPDNAPSSKAPNPFVPKSSPVATPPPTETPSPPPASSSTPSTPTPAPPSS